MNRRQAGQLSTHAAHYFQRHEDYSQEKANAANTAFFLQAQDFLPDGTRAAVIEHEDGLPLIVATDDEHLYSIEFAGFPNEDKGLASTRATLRRLDSEKSRVSCEARYRGSHSFGHHRHSTWRITVEDLEMVIETRTDEDGEADDREAFAQHLAGVLGWRFGGGREKQGLSEAA